MDTLGVVLVAEIFRRDLAGPYHFSVYAVRMAQPHVCPELFANKSGMEAKFSGLQRALLRK